MKINAIKNLFIFLFVFCFVSSASAQETITLTTYYPSPFGVYQQLEVGQTLMMSPSPNPGCSQPGLMYYDALEGLRICDGGDWTGNAGLWRKQPNPNFDIYQQNIAAQVGMGTATPDEMLHVLGNIKVEGDNVIAFGEDGEAGPYGLDFQSSNADLVYDPGSSQLRFRNAGAATVFALDEDDSAAYFGGNVAIGSTSVLPGASLTVTGNATVTGASTLSGNVTMQGTAAVTGPTTLNSTLNVILATTLSNTLAVTGVSTFNEDVFIAGGTSDLSVAGISTLAGIVSIGGGAADCGGCDLDVVGSIEAGSFFYPSDETLKENIHPISGLENIKRLNGIRYTWKESGEADLGVTAQNVEEVFPELVNTNPVNGIKSIKADRIIAPLIEAVKEQQQMIEAQQKEIDQLKNEMLTLQENTF